jgi:membrane protein DedA with SNARE-associated domain
MELLTAMWPYVANHAHLFLFLGMLVGGETFLLPAIYLAIQGTLRFSDVLLLALLATVVSDVIWYTAGRFVPLEKIFSFGIFQKKREAFNKIIGVFKKHSQKLLYISKFVYGTRTIIQISSGVIRIPFLRYTTINLAGVISYLLVITLLAILTKESLVSLEEVVYYEYVSIAIFIVIIAVIHIWLKKWLGKNFTVPSSQPGTKSEQSEM